MVDFLVEIIVNDVLIKHTLTCNGCDEVITPVQDIEIVQTAGQRRSVEDLLRAFQRMAREYGGENVSKVEILKT